MLAVGGNVGGHFYRNIVVTRLLQCDDTDEFRRLHGAGARLLAALAARAGPLRPRRHAISDPTRCRNNGKLNTMVNRYMFVFDNGNCLAIEF